MRKTRILAPLALAAAAALAAGVATLLKKPAAEAAEAAAPQQAPSGIKNLRSGSYSFISGFQDAVTVELGMDYDGEKYGFAVIEDEFPSYSGDSHVAVVWGEDFNMQLEYASYYSGEDFAAHCRGVAERYQGFRPLRFGSLEGVSFIDGDNICIHLPIPGDAHSYLLVTLMKSPDNDEDFTALPEHPDVQAMLGSLRFQII